MAAGNGVVNNVNARKNPTPKDAHMSEMHDINDMHDMPPVSGMSSEDRFIDIEMKLTRQEDLVDELNRTVYRQQQKIEELEMLLIALGKRFKEATNASQERAAANERPPHY